MENAIRELVAGLSYVGIAILAGGVTWLLKNWADIRIKVQGFWEQKLDEWIEKHLVSVLKNTYETYTKNTKTDISAWTDSAKKIALDLSTQSVMTIMPSAFKKKLGKIFSGFEDFLKKKIQIFYENHKDEINK